MGEIIPEIEDEDEVKTIIAADSFVRHRPPPLLKSRSNAESAEPRA